MDRDSRDERFKRPTEQFGLFEAWERAGRESTLWHAWLDLNERIVEAEAKWPLVPAETETLIKLFGGRWRQKRREYEDDRDAIIGPLTNRRANIREEINEALRENMLRVQWQATGRPDDPLAAFVEIDPEAWCHFDLGAIKQNCLIYPRYFRRNQTRKFIYQVNVTIVAEKVVRTDPIGQSSPVKRLILAIEQQIAPPTAVFRQTDLFREINCHLARSLQASAKQLNLKGKLESLSGDKRFALLQHFLRTVLPELGPEVINKTAMEILERKLLGASLDCFSTNALQSISPEALRHRIDQASSSS